MSVREVQLGLSGALRRVQKGAEVTITRRGKAVARLVPMVSPLAESDEAAAAGWDAVEAHLESFPGGPLADTPVSDQLIADREDRG